MKDSMPNPVTSKPLPKLASPGAGLPWAQRVLLRYYLGPFVAKASTWEGNRKKFEEINEKILKLVEGLSPDQMKERVLVSPQKGLEDSSRYWSLAMTLEHLALVGSSMAHIIVMLSNGQRPGMVVDIAKVKPMGMGTPQEALTIFKRFAETTSVEISQKIGNRDSRVTHIHPWFGPITAKQWQWVLASHSAIHYLQMKHIKAMLIS